MHLLPAVEVPSRVRVSVAPSNGPTQSDITDRGSITRPGTPATRSHDGISFARVAVFDLKGDGHIDPRSVSEGGDATMLVPDYPLYLPTDARVVAMPESSRARPAQRPTSLTTNPLTAPTPPIRTQRAAAAYRHAATTAVSPSDARDSTGVG